MHQTLRDRASDAMVALFIISTEVQHALDATTITSNVIHRGSREVLGTSDDV
jgi:hypothetical protein